MMHELLNFNPGSASTFITIQDEQGQEVKLELTKDNAASIVEWLVLKVMNSEN
jgi:hypothetical protein